MKGRLGSSVTFLPKESLTVQKSAMVKEATRLYSTATLLILLNYVVVGNDTQNCAKNKVDIPYL